MTTDASPDQSPFVPQCLELRTGVSEGFYLVGEAANGALCSKLGHATSEKEVLSHAEMGDEIWEWHHLTGWVFHGLHRLSK